MKISLEWIRDYVELPCDLSAKQIAHDLTMTTVEVEAIIDLAAGLDGTVVGRVTSVGDPDVAAGLVRCDIGRGESTIVVTTHRLTPGMLVALSPRQPDSGDDGSPRMALGTPAELGLAELFPDQHARGPLHLQSLSCQPGQSLAQAIGWSDVVLEIDNKSLTNRPDLWGHYGLAREFSAIYDQPLQPLPVEEPNRPPKVLIGNIDSAVCNRFTAMLVSNVWSGDAPFWMRSRLWRVGQRPRNFFADLTNYIMLTVGQPCHAFDAAVLSLPLSVRRSDRGELFKGIDGTELRLTPSDFVVADTKSPVALAGIIGGADSAITAETRQVLFEAANFDALTVRRTSTSTGIRTDASSRFEKALATQRIDEARRLFFDIMRREQPSATVAGFDDRVHQETTTRTIRVTTDFLRRRIGGDLATDRLREPLEKLGLVVEVHDDGQAFVVTVPEWRNTGDISGAADLVEEIARLHGYENFDFRPPVVRLENTVRDFAGDTERRIKEYLAFRCGMQEVVNYPWVEGKYLRAASCQVGPDTLYLAALRVHTDDENAAWQGTLRTSLIPGLLQNIVSNLRWSPSFGVFEAGSVFPGSSYSSADDPREKLPQQPKRIAAALVGTDAEPLFSQAKGMLESLGHYAHLEPLRTQSGVRTPWADPGASVIIMSDSRPVGFLGVLSQRAAVDAGIKRSHAALFEIELDGLAPLPSRDNRYRKLPELPWVDVDVSMTYPDTVTWEAIRNVALAVDQLITEVHFVDQYRGTRVPSGHRAITLRARLQPTATTLTTEEATRIAEALKNAACRQLGASIRS